MTSYECDAYGKKLHHGEMFKIGEMRPWPDTGHVIRGKTGEVRRYAPERTCELEPLDELLPCPFCGGEASKRLFYKGKYRVHCNACDAHSGDVCDTEAEAIAAWNARAHGMLTTNDVLNAVYEHGARWQAIADELNARAERK